MDAIVGMELVALKCGFLVIECMQIAFRTWRNSMMMDDGFIGGWYYLNMIAMWWIDIVYIACSAYMCHDEDQLNGNLALEESYFMYN